MKIVRNHNMKNFFLSTAQIFKFVQYLRLTKITLQVQIFANVKIIEMSLKIIIEDLIIIINN